MKAKLVFDLDNSDDRSLYKKHNKAVDMSYFIFYLLRKRKNMEFILDNLDDNNNDKYDVLELLYSEINKLLAEHSIDIDDIVE